MYETNSLLSRLIGIVPTDFLQINLQTIVFNNQTSIFRHPLHLHQKVGHHIAIHLSFVVNIYSLGYVQQPSSVRLGQSLGLAQLWFAGDGSTQSSPGRLAPCLQLLQQSEERGGLSDPTELYAERLHLDEQLLRITVLLLNIFILNSL